MSSENYQLEALVREDLGRSHARKARRGQKIPAVIYGKKLDPVHLFLNEKDLSMMFKRVGSLGSAVVELSWEGLKKPQVALIKDIQRHPFKPRITHIDFYAVDRTQVVQRAIPLRFIGVEDSQAAKEGVTINMPMHEVLLECTVENIPDGIEVSCAHLQEHTVIHMSELVLPKEVKFVNEPEGDSDHPVVVATTVMIEEEPEEEVLEGAEEGETAEESGDQEENTDAKTEDKDSEAS